MVCTVYLEMPLHLIMYVNTGQYISTFNDIYTCRELNDDIWSFLNFTFQGK